MPQPQRPSSYQTSSLTTLWVILSHSSSSGSLLTASSASTHLPHPSINFIQIQIFDPTMLQSLLSRRSLRMINNQETLNEIQTSWIDLLAGKFFEFLSYCSNLNVWPSDTSVRMYECRFFEVVSHGELLTILRLGRLSEWSNQSLDLGNAPFVFISFDNFVSAAKESVSCKPM